MQYRYGSLSNRDVVSLYLDDRLLVDLGQKLVVAEKRELVFADLDGGAAELS
jgi:hypothetical protein